MVLLVLERQTIGRTPMVAMTTVLLGSMMTAVSEWVLPYGMFYRWGLFWIDGCFRANYCLCVINVRTGTPTGLSFPFGTLGAEAEFAIFGKFASVRVDCFVAILLGYQKTVAGAE